MNLASRRGAARRPRAIGPPGMLAWTALPLRDQRLITWLWAGDVVNAELAAVLAYGNLRVAQRRLARLVEYGILRGFWAANRQRPRGRYAYALTKAARKDVEYLLWEHDAPEPVTGQVQAPSPVIHQLATHDLLAAFLRASPLTDDIGLAGWVPEHAAALRYDGALRPDAIAVVRRGEVATLLIIERDLGSERHEILLDKLRRYNFINVHPAGSNLGFILDSRRRAGALLVSLRAAAKRSAGVIRRVWHPVLGGGRCRPAGRPVRYPLALARWARGQRADHADHRRARPAPDPLGAALAR